MPDAPDAAELGDLLADDCTRRILVETKSKPCSAAELSDRTGASEPTVYRRLERLREHDLVAEEIRPVTDGKNYSVYRARLDGIRIALEESPLVHARNAQSRSPGQRGHHSDPRSGHQLHRLPRVPAQPEPPDAVCRRGFVLIVAVPAVATLGLYFLLNVPPVFNALAQAAELAGMGAILYGLWMPGRS